MSADLFAEFSGPASGQSQQQELPQNWGNLEPQRGSGWSGATTSQAGAQPVAGAGAASAAEDDDDGWGDFEAAHGSVAEPPAAQLAAGGPSSPGTSLATSQFNVFPGQAQAASTAPQLDPWEVFERPSQPATQSTQQYTSTNTPNAASFQNVGGTRLVRANTMDIISNNLVEIGQHVKAKGESRDAKPKLKQPSNPNVMFDAEDFELEGGDEDDDFDEDDEFGDFETVPAPQTKPVLAVTESRPKSPSRHVPQPPPMDLLSLDDPPPYAESPPVGTETERKPSVPHSFGATAKAQTQEQTRPRKLLPVNKSSRLREATLVGDGDDDNDDEWNAWDDFESKPASGSAKEVPASSTDSWDWDPRPSAQPSKPAADDGQPPPTNVPPPSVLLSAFPGLFSAGDTLFKPMAGQTKSIKERVLSDPKAADFLRGYVSIATTAGRVIAGRKHRWHRDKILAKSMSISAAGSKGMKLAGVDKTQSVREDRDAADVAAAWREYVGRLRSAVAATNSSGKTSLKVPEISENMQVQTAKLVPTAPKPCVICGLKRDERVTKVDFDVEDSFGEWWVEHWGHRACKNFWIEHEQALRQR